jgi:signal transduction histidine kinase
MRVEDAIASIAGLAAVEGRADRARQFAVSMGADALLLFTLRADSGKFVPAAGGPKTLPGGQEWRALLDACRTPGAHYGEVIAMEPRALAPAAACSDGATALVFLGGAVAPSDLEQVRWMLPLLGAALHEQQRLSIATGELAAARFEMTQYASLAKALDASRAKVDVTMRELAHQARRLEAARGQAENAARAKDEFLAMLGHELRNPLAPMVTVLQVLRLRGEWTPELAIMQRQVDHMQRLVDDLLDVARIAGGKLTLQPRRIELIEVVRAAQETAAPLIMQKRQQVCIDVPDSGVRVDADPARLAQVFANLFTNAAKYSDEGTTIRVQTTVHHDNVVIEVVDQGIGIEAGMLGRVFDLFEQQNTSIDRARGGLGLGLAIVRNLVQQHGGHVHADSAGLGKGSRFIVELPLASGEVAPEEAVNREPAPLVRPGERILLVDDNADARDTLARALRLAGYTVEVAVDGHRALERARVFHPRLALLDIGLPGMDGYELASRLRSIGNPVPKLVALTGYGQPNDKQRAFDSGFDRHLVKPVDFPHLQGVIEALLDTPS